MITELEKKIGYTFKNKTLLMTALSHSSYANERHADGIESYERLEFLGDSILGFVTADYLYSRVQLPEGKMTKLRAELVCEESLHAVALELEIGKYMRLGRGEEITGGRQRVSILADMVESVIAAIYLDGGLDEAKSFVLGRVLADAHVVAAKKQVDYNTHLQEVVQRKSGQTIAYELAGESGPDHAKVFAFRVLINGVNSGEGSGRTKKEAEQMAAKAALEALGEL